MKDKLRAYLRDSKGFTLVELLVVIAIIAILVLLVIVAINPLERIRDAQDRNAQNSVRQAASAAATCVTKELSRTPPGTPFTSCDNAFLVAQNYVQTAGSLTGVTVTPTGTDICITHPNANGHGPVAWLYSTSQINDPDGGAPPC